MYVSDSILLLSKETCTFGAAVSSGWVNPHGSFWQYKSEATGLAHRVSHRADILTSHILSLLGDP